MLTSLHSDFTLASLVEAHGGDEIYAAEIPMRLDSTNSDTRDKEVGKEGLNMTLREYVEKHVRGGYE